jgi:hypothetical protein
MKPTLRSLALIVLIVIAAAPALAEGNANFLLGMRQLDEDTWDPLDQQGVFGVTVDFGGADWPIHLETGFYGSSDKEDVFDDTILVEGDLKVDVVEVFFGVNKTWDSSGSIRPFVGGGLASAGASIEVDTPFGDVDDDDSSLGAYAHGGVFWRLGQRFNIGFDARFLTGTDLTVFDEDVDVDYLQAGLVLGFGWPKSQ